MGVPAFFRWLTRKYRRSLIIDAVEETTVDGSRVNSLEPNPNNMEFDNLYLDMNGIIHPCCHPEEGRQPESEDEMLEAVFALVDRIFGIVRPRKLLYLAIDGCAPRAKMNQQRGRRFRAAQARMEKDRDHVEYLHEVEIRGEDVGRRAKETWDSNAITPGTAFMDRVAEALRYYVALRLSSDPGWRNIMVLLSDSNVPGEGEHKIMDFIRHQRGFPSHDPNTKHVIVGLDADLIMLGLGTHEPYFTIMREEVFPAQKSNRRCTVCGGFGHANGQCRSNLQEVVADLGSQPVVVAKKPFQFVHLSILREYLALEFASIRVDLKDDYDIERLIDDFIVLCYFAGNDFLPSLPSLEIREGAIDRLVSAYKSCRLGMGGYLTDKGNLNFQRLKPILAVLASEEAEIFKQRRRRAMRDRDRARRRILDDARYQADLKREIVGSDLPEMTVSVDPFLQKARHDAASNPLDNRSAAQQLRDQLLHDVMPDLPVTPSEGTSSKRLASDVTPEREAKRQKMDSEKQSGVLDPDKYEKVRLWEAGYRKRWYHHKFGVDCDEDHEFVVKLTRDYLEGLSWVLKYYCLGVRGWKWFYPHNYPPFASDFDEFPDFNFKFELGEPFAPFDQLLGVLPAESAHCLPKPFAKLMRDADSPILDFFPSEFPIDYEGKRFEWQGIPILPFIDEHRLLEASKSVDPDSLSAAERERNERREALLIVSKDHQLAPSLTKSVRVMMEAASDGGVLGWMSLETGSSGGMAGLFAPISGSLAKHFPSVLENNILRNPFVLEEFRGRHPPFVSSVVSVACRLPKMSEDQFPRGLLPGACLPAPTIVEDLKSAIAPTSGMGFYGRQNRNGFGRGANYSPPDRSSGYRRTPYGGRDVYPQYNARDPPDRGHDAQVGPMYPLDNNQAPFDRQNGSRRADRIRGSLRQRGEPIYPPYRSQAPYDQHGRLGYSPYRNQDPYPQQDGFRDRRGRDSYSQRGGPADAPFRSQAPYSHRDGGMEPVDPSDARRRREWSSWDASPTVRDVGRPGQLSSGSLGDPLGSLPPRESPSVRPVNLGFLRAPRSSVRAGERAAAPSRIVKESDVTALPRRAVSRRY